MIIVDEQKQIGQVPRGCVLSIGNFDGVHLGHQAILRSARQIADRSNLSLAVMTFDPHPAALLYPQRAPQTLTPLAYKAALLEPLGVEYLIVVKDTMRLLNLSPQDFVDQFLMKHLAPRFVVEGSNFNFGYGRSGTVSTLKDLGRERGFEVMEVPFTKVQFEQDQREQICSSSLVRTLLEEGQPADAARILGRPYRLIGKTIPGRGIGKHLGFPTANIEPLEQLIPSEGVYAGCVVTGRSSEDAIRQAQKRPAALSVGRAKTFVSDHPLLLKAHILEENVEDLQNMYLGFEFIQRLRHQQRFESSEELKKQIAADCRKIRQILNTSSM